MLTTAAKYPAFDPSEITPDVDLSYKVYHPLEPAKAGDTVSRFVLHNDEERWQLFYNGREKHSSIPLKELLAKPLVISFYSKHWRNVGLKQLNKLNVIQQEIKANGGNLLVIGAERDDAFVKTAWDHSFSLNFYYDKDNEIAELFNVYSEHDPAWNKFSGIDANVPLLATYVINTSKMIVYNHIDLDFSGSFSPQDIVAAVYNSALFQ